MNEQSKSKAILKLANFPFYSACNNFRIIALVPIFPICDLHLGECKSSGQTDSNSCVKNLNNENENENENENMSKTTEDCTSNKLSTFHESIDSRVLDMACEL